VERHAERREQLVGGHRQTMPPPTRTWHGGKAADQSAMTGMLTNPIRPSRSYWSAQWSGHFLRYL